MNGFGWLMGLVVVLVIVVSAKLCLGASRGGGAMAREKIKQGATVIDVRTPSEYASGHCNGATNIPLQALPNRLADVGDKKKAVVVYCASGMRSAQAARILTAAGFMDVTNAGGLRNLE